MEDNTFYFDNVWRLLKSAREIPDIVGSSKRTMILTIGEDNFGFSIGDCDSKLVGDAIDITDYTIKVRCISLPYPPSLLEASMGYNWEGQYTLFTNECTITDAENGICTLSMSRNDLDYRGQVLFQIIVENADGDKKIIGTMKCRLLQSFFTTSE